MGMMRILLKLDRGLLEVGKRQFILTSVSIPLLNWTRADQPKG